MKPATLTAIQFAAMLGIAVKAHLTDPTKVSLRGSAILLLAFLTATGLTKILDPKETIVKGKNYLWAHIPRIHFDAIAVPVPKDDTAPEVAPTTFTGTASA